MRNLLRYLFPKDRRKDIPYLRTAFKNEFDLQSLDDDQELILLAGVARDPLHADTLMNDYEAASALELLHNLPGRRRTGFSERLGRWLQLLEGSSTTDPYLREYQEAKKLYRSPRD